MEVKKEEIDLFGNLSREIAIAILSRLPNIGSIIKCKLVWRDVVESGEFAEFHFSKPDPHPHLVVFRDTRRTSKCSKILELEDTPNMVVVDFGLCDSPQPLVRTSINGLILIQCCGGPLQRLLICNPITREYFRIPDPPHRAGHPRPQKYRSRRIKFGFGVSRSSKQYKVVRIMTQYSECLVYTLGAGAEEWRSIEVGSPHMLSCKWTSGCAFVGGNLHWLVVVVSRTTTTTRSVSNVGEVISCFDLETEVFTSFSAPPSRRDCWRSLCVLDDRLCLCDTLTKYEHLSEGVEIDIWVRREQDWSREFVIRDINGGGGLGYVLPIKVLEDGGILLCQRGKANNMLNYSKKKTKTGGGEYCVTRFYPNYDIHQFCYGLAVVSTPSFLPLKTLFMESKVASRENL